MEYITLMVGVAVLVVTVAILMKREEEENLLNERIDMLEEDVVELYQQNQHYRQAIEAHCHITECVTPDLSQPYQTINNVIAWHVQTYRDLERMNG